MLPRDELGGKVALVDFTAQAAERHSPGWIPQSKGILEAEGIVQRDGGDVGTLDVQWMVSPAGTYSISTRVLAW